MPALRKGQVTAILCSDIHLSLKPPIWRSAEPDWFEAMVRPLKEISSLQNYYGCPVLCAGDVFDRWNCAPELINFAITHLPDNMWAIPGQHDLPYHNYEDIKKSAYWTLVRANTINYIHPNTPTLMDGADGIVMMGFPWGHKVTPVPIKRPKRNNTTRIAALHEYNWIPGKEYPTAPKTSRLTSKRKNFKGWDIVCIGDNHKGFKYKIGETTFFNCGSLMRRKSDEVNYRPWIGLVTTDKDVIPHYLDTSKDKYLQMAKDSKGCPGKALDMDGFLQGLAELGKDALDFETAIKHYNHKHNTRRPVRNIIKESMGM